MAGVNKVILIGNLGNQPEVRHTQSNQAVTELSIATNRKYKDRDDNWTEHTEWHSVVVWGAQAENCARYLTKGRQVYVEGRLQTRNWTDKNEQKHYKTEIVAQTVQFLSGGRGEDGGSGPGAPRGDDRGSSSSGEGDRGYSRPAASGVTGGASSASAATGASGAGAGDDPDDIPF